LQASSEGHEIGNHTITHPCSGNFPWSRANPLEEYTLERMETELTDASVQIERWTGTRPTTFAYPCGQKFVGRGEGLVSYVPLVGRHFLVGRSFNDESSTSPGFCDLSQVCGAGFDALSFDQVKTLIDSTVAQGCWLILA